MLKVLESVADGIGLITGIVVRLMLAAVAAILFVQVLLRYGFGFSLPWPEEAARYLMIWVVMLAGSLLVKDDQLVRVDFLDHLWPRRALAFRNALFRVLLAAMLAVLVWTGYNNADFGARRTSPTLGLSFYWIYLSVPVGAGLMMFHMLVLALRDLVKGPPNDGPSVLKAEN